MSGDLEGRIAVITGAGSGIGQATALLFADHGAHVIAVDVSDGLEHTARLGGGRIETVHGDAGDEAAIDNLVNDVMERHGRIDVFFANAGISGGFKPLFEQDMPSAIYGRALGSAGARRRAHHKATPMLINDPAA